MEESELPYVVVEIERRTSTVVEVWLSPREQPITHLPGQYVLLEDVGRGLPPRSYSVANAPRKDALVSLFVTRVPDGQLSRWVYDRMRVGDEVTLSGPYGTFVADRFQTGPVLYLAAGSGLAPIRALVEAAVEERPLRSSMLVFSARTEADVLDGAHLARLAIEYPGFRFVRTLTRGSGPPPHGRIPAILPGLRGKLDGYEVFIAGAPAFVRECAAVSERLGARRACVHTESFFVDEPLPRPA
jgi:CDP-4-dehydro-6-deoxyglucose reductase, E3